MADEGPLLFTPLAAGACQCSGPRTSNKPSQQQQKAEDVKWWEEEWVHTWLSRSLLVSFSKIGMFSSQFTPQRTKQHCDRRVEDCSALEKRRKKKHKKWQNVTNINEVSVKEASILHRCAACEANRRVSLRSSCASSLTSAEGCVRLENSFHLYFMLKSFFFFFH